MRASSGHAMVILGMLCFATPVSAQYSTLTWSSRGPTCEPVSPRSGTCPTSCPSSLVCRQLNPSQFACVLVDVGFCVDEAAGGACPYDRRVRQRLSGTGIFACLPDSPDFCPDLLDPRPCFSSPPDPMGGADFPIDFLYGDCDADTIANGVDAEPCEPSPEVSFISPAGHCAPAQPCGGPSMCGDGALCSTADAVDPHTYCFPGDGAVVFCCGGFGGAQCPNGDPCITAHPDDYGFCPDFEFCPEMPFAERLACIRDGAAFVDPDLGDCDEDGIRNAEDDAPCEAYAVDAGTLQDAGVDGGGAGMDGGSPPEDIVPSFKGGGGCVCRAAPTGGGSVAWLVGLLGLIVIRRRR